MHGCGCGCVGLWVWMCGCGCVNDECVDGRKDVSRLSLILCLCLFVCLSISLTHSRCLSCSLSHFVCLSVSVAVCLSPSLSQTISLSMSISPCGSRYTSSNRSRYLPGTASLKSFFPCCYRSEDHAPPTPPHHHRSADAGMSSLTTDQGIPPPRQEWQPWSRTLLVPTGCIDSHRSHLLQLRLHQSKMRMVNYTADDTSIQK